MALASTALRPSRATTRAALWWRRAVVYQVYLRSFSDSDGDGRGDINGLRARLPYLRDLGVDAIWINPWYPSPLLDGGYDVADYRDIDPRLGTLEQAEALIAEAHDHGLRLLVDLVANHTSWEHPWFNEARGASTGSAARERYIFRHGRGKDGELPPNNWTSFFGGPAWTQVDDGQWYLHLFDTSQPDLNWDNPEVRNEFLDILRFWLERGVDGFRVDVAHSLIKAAGLPDIAAPFSHNEAGSGGNAPYLDRDEVHRVIRTWRAVLDEYDDRVMIAEAHVHPTRLPQYVREGEYHQAFNFQFLEDGWLGHLHNEHVPEVLDAMRAEGAMPTWVLSNHDEVRHATRFGLPDTSSMYAKRWLGDGRRRWLDEAQGQRRARAAALLILALPGSVYLYQGEELGLPEVHDLPDEVLQDPEFLRSDRKGRDGCRVPLPWDHQGPGFGFGSERPWLPQPSYFARYAVSTQLDDSDSMLCLYRSALRLRDEHGRDDDEAQFLDLGRDVVAFRRGSGLTCVVNMGTQPVDLPDGELLLSSGSTRRDGSLCPDDAVWLMSSARASP